MMPESSSGRGAAKVILLGEHAVVHGTRALALSLPIGVVAEARRTNRAYRLTVPAWNHEVTAGDGTSSEQALLAIARALELRLDGIEIDAAAAIPARSGLGASAAVAAAAAGALAALYRKAVSRDALFEAVQASEKVFHGNPSGIDARLALGAGVILFSKAKGVSVLSVNAPRLIVVHSGTPGETRQTVARFAEKMRRSPEEANRRIEAIDGLVERGAAALRTGDTAALGELMVRNHKLLSWFDVSSEALDRIVEVAMSAGALGAKMTGGGGGGCAVVLPGEAGETVVEEMRSEGFLPLAI